MKLLSRIFFHILLIALSFVFIVSALTKFAHTEIFEFFFVQTGLFSWSVAPFAARLLIGIELILGTFLLFHLYVKRTLQLSIIFLLLLTFYLAASEFLSFGNSNCGCFGLFWIMTPLTAILKNLVLLLLALFLLFKSSQMTTFRLNNILAVLLFIVLMALPFIFSPIVIANKSVDDIFKDKIQIDDLQNLWNEKYIQSGFAEGKWCVLLASASCPHCVGAAFKLKILSQKHKHLKIAFFINGNDNKIQQFRVMSNTTDVPYVKVPAKIVLQYTHGMLPAIFFIADNQIHAKVTDYYSLNDDFVKEWLKKDE